MSYFRISEFTCKCGCNQNHVSPALVAMLERARSIAGIPFIINSGYRCNKHNKDINGSRTSSHLKGLAVDIRVNSNQDRMSVLKGLTEAGFERIGISDNFIHADIDDSKIYSCWCYN